MSSHAYSNWSNRSIHMFHDALNVHIDMYIDIDRSIHSCLESSSSSSYEKMNKHDILRVQRHREYSRCHLIRQCQLNFLSIGAPVVHLPHRVQQDTRPIIKSHLLYTLRDMYISMRFFKSNQYSLALIHDYRYGSSSMLCARHIQDNMKNMTFVSHLLSRKRGLSVQKVDSYYNQSYTRSFSPKKGVGLAILDAHMYLFYV